MHYEVELFDELLRGFINHKEGEDINGEIKQYELRRTLETHISSIHSYINEAFFAATDDTLRRAAVHRLQLKISSLAESLHGCCEAVLKEDVTSYKTKQRQTSPVDAACQTLESLLKYLHRFFNPYFNVDAPVPQCCLRKYKAECAQQLEDLIERLTGQTDPNLWQLIANKVYRCFDNSRGMSFQQLGYWRELISALTTCCNSFQAVDDEQLLSLLIHHNFNSYLLFSYKAGAIRKDLARLASTHEKMTYLKSHLGFLAGIPVRQGTALFPEQAGFRQVMEDFLQRELQLVVEDTQTLPAAAPGKAAQHTQLQTAYSWPVVAVMFRLLNELKILYIDNKSAFFSFIQQHVISPQQKQTTTNRLGDIYYKLEDPTYEVAWDLLHTMMNQLKCLKMEEDKKKRKGRRSSKG